MNVTGKLYKLDFDIENYSKAAKKAAETQVRQAARAFARAALEHIPVRTGFAAGSLGAITGTKPEGYSSPAGAERALANLFRRYGIAKEFRNEYYQGVLKTPMSGRQFAQAIFTEEGNTFYFNFTVDIIYYTINDFFANRFTPSAPWGSFEAGKAAFETYLKTIGVSKLPNPLDFIVRTEVSL